MEKMKKTAVKRNEKGMKKIHEDKKIKNKVKEKVREK